MRQSGEKFIELLQIILRLRAPDGCPWDREQTPRSLKKYLIEEAYETAEALEKDDPVLVREELGDLLFMVALLSLLYQEGKHFTMTDVISGICAKMVRRHPHVFAGTAAGSLIDQQRNWQAIKEQEKKAAGQKTERFTSLPRSLPALRRAQRVSEKAARTGFDWSGIKPVFAKLDEEVAELKTALGDNDQGAVFEELGDVLFVLVNICRLAGHDSEDALNSATAKFIRRFGVMEEMLAGSGLSLTGLDDATLLHWWNKTKKN
ncbi:MAG: nucleoside triphosphate pyrophosphohydrolase [Desulfobacterales bacterium]|nr:nucleoside triphosphate pyrophosphohydrolase [Desulfobacterales bacterium]